MLRREVSSALLAGAVAGRLKPAAGSPQGRADDASASPAELRAGAHPRGGHYAEGDIRRYGADPAAPDNSAAINLALRVSSYGGSAAFVPAGVWSISSPLRAVGVSSMFGEGNSSVIAANGCDGLTFENGGNYAETGTARFMRDFRIVGGDPHRSACRGIRVDLSVASGRRVTGIHFDNLYIANFGTAVFLRGLYNSNFENCFFYNNYRGVYFYGQTITTSITNCNIQRGTLAGDGGAWGISFQAVDGETTENTHISGGQIYGYDINVNVDLAFELQIEHCDISEAQSIGVQITSTIGGLWVRDCWIETAKSAVTTGILVNDITPTVNAKINITGNYLTCDFPHAGSQGIRIGNSNAGIVVNENQIYGFDRGITLGASAHLTCKFNTINIHSAVYSATSHALLLHSTSTDNDVGPNYIVPGAKRRAVADGTSQLAVESAESFPPGTPVQFDMDALGFHKGVTYFVASSRGTAMSVAPGPGQAAIQATGSGPLGHVFSDPLPLSFTAETPAGLSFHGRGSFVMTLSGFAAPVAGVVNWVASGRLVALSAASGSVFLGMSDSVGLEARGLPRFLLPASVQYFSASIIDSDQAAWGLGTVTLEGTLLFHATPARTGFAASGRKGLGAATWVFPYA